MGLPSMNGVPCTNHTLVQCSKSPKNVRKNDRYTSKPPPQNHAILVTISVIYIKKSTHFGDLRNFRLVYILKNVKSQDFDRRQVDMSAGLLLCRDPTTPSMQLAHTCAMCISST